MGKFFKCLQRKRAKPTGQKSKNVESTASKQNISANSSKSNSRSICSIFQCMSRKPPKYTTRKRRRYRVSKRTIELAKPKMPRKKYQPPRFRFSTLKTSKPKTNKISKRTDELALPYVRYNKIE